MPTMTMADLTAFDVESSPGAPLLDLSTRELETELLGLAGHIAAAQCRFLQLLAEYDRRDGWAGPGLRSCAHWLSWRIGMSLRTATEHVRVARALADLPKITAAFAAGTISYSKVRAITRVTTAAPDAPDDPPAPADPDDPDDPDVGNPPGAGPEAVRPEPPSAAPVSETSEPPQPPAAPPLVLGPDAEQTLLKLALGGTASHVEAVVRATRRRLADPDRTAALRSLSWRWAEDGSLVLRGRFTPAEGAALVAAVEALVPAREPVTHPVPNPPPGWQDTAPEQEPGAVSDRVGARRADALFALVTRPDPGPDQAEQPEVQRGEARVVVHFDATSGDARIDGGPEIPAATAERLACDAEVQLLLEDRLTNRLYLGRSRRLASPAQIAALTVRDGRRCLFPGCSHTLHLHAHHVVHWLHGGRTDLDNLMLLCSFHHVLIHDRGYRIRRDGAGWAFQRPDGLLVPATTAPLVGNVESLIEINTRAELAITRDSLTPTWAGERLDLDPILDTLLPRQVRRAA